MLQTLVLSAQCKSHCVELGDGVQVRVGAAGKQCYLAMLELNHSAADLPFRTSYGQWNGCWYMVDQCYPYKQGETDQPLSGPRDALVTFFPSHGFVPTDRQELTAMLVTSVSWALFPMLPHLAQ